MSKRLNKEVVFKNELHDWMSQSRERLKVPPNTIKISSTKELFFEGKLYEIYLRYISARTMLRPIDNNREEYWYDNERDPSNDDLIRLTYNGFFIENAILNYNIVVDLTWIITIISIEICYYENSKKIILDDINEIYSSKCIINKIQQMVQSPSAEEVKEFLDYFSKLNPKYQEIAEHISSFWNSFFDSEIRTLYNFLKHRGKPEYTEIYKITGRKFFSFKDNKIEYATDISDLRKEVEMYKTLEDLIDFDNNTLFPYCDKLFKLLIKIIYD